MTNPEQFSLSGIASTIYRYFGIIIIVAFLSGVAGFIMAYLKTKSFEAETEFFLKNPFYADRNFLFNSDTKFIDYFAHEDDVNRLVSLSGSDSVQTKIIREFNLVSAYKADTTDPRHMTLLRQSLSGNLKISRTSNKTVMLRYTDKDAERAAEIANRLVVLLEQELRNFYNGTRLSMHASIMNKVQEEDSMVRALTDTLVAMRNQYQIYDLISPSRANVILSGVKHTGKSDFAKGLEEIQNVASLKDNAVSNRTWHLSLAQQYTTGTKWNELPLTKIITIAKPAIKPTGAGKTLTAIICAIIGGTVAVLFVLVMHSTKRGA